MTRLKLTLNVSQMYGRKISHIKLFRCITDCGLKEAKDFCEEHDHASKYTLGFYVTYEQLGRLFYNMSNGLIQPGYVDFFVISIEKVEVYATDITAM